MRAMHLSEIIWSGKSFDDHERQLMAWMSEVQGYETEESTMVRDATVYVSGGIRIFQREPGKYWSMLFIEYCILIGKRSIAEMKEEAEQFFIGIWKTGHGGFVEALEQASAIDTTFSIR